MSRKCPSFPSSPDRIVYPICGGRNGVLRRAFLRFFFLPEYRLIPATTRIGLLLFCCNIFLAPALRLIRNGHFKFPRCQQRFQISLTKMLMYGKEASNRKQEIDRQHHTIPNQRPKDKHYGNVHSQLYTFPRMPTMALL